MDPRVVLEKGEVIVKDTVVTTSITILQMPDPLTFDLHLEGDLGYLVQFTNPLVFGREFAMLNRGDNLFKIITPTESTGCLFFSELQLHTILAGVPVMKTKIVTIPPGL